MKPKQCPISRPRQNALNQDSQIEEIWRHLISSQQEIQENFNLSFYIRLINSIAIAFNTVGSLIILIYTYATS